MDVKAVVSVVVIALMAVGLTFWIAGSAVSDNSGDKDRLSSYEDDRDAPPPDEEGPRPKAVTDETLYNFGGMELGEKKQHTFLLKNEGEDTLVIAKGASTCKCTVSDLPSNEIAPGEAAEVNLEWEPKGISTAFSQSARIWTNDPERRAIDFRVEGVVHNLVELLPGSALDAGNILEETGGKTRLRVISELTDQITEPEITYSGKWLSFETVKTPEEDLKELNAKFGYDINIHVVPDVPVGNNRDRFEIKFTANGKELQHEVSVDCTRKGPVTIFAVPGTKYIERINLIDFERFLAEKGKKQAVTIMIDDPPDGQPIELTVEKNEFPDMKVNIEPNRQLALNKRQAFNVTFQVPPGLPPVDRARQHAVTVTFHTTHPQVSEIKLNLGMHSH